MLLYPACNNDSPFLGLSQAFFNSSLVMFSAFLFYCVLSLWCLGGGGGGGSYYACSTESFFSPHELHHSGIRTSKEPKKFLHLFHPSELPRMHVNYTSHVPSQLFCCHRHECWRSFFFVCIFFNIAHLRMCHVSVLLPSLRLDIPITGIVVIVCGGKYEQTKWISWHAILPESEALKLAIATIHMPSLHGVL
jgi:hypothetical protein